LRLPINNGDEETNLERWEKSGVAVFVEALTLEKLMQSTLLC